MTESTNFVSEEDFEKLLNSIPIQSGNEKMSVEDWMMLFRVMYGCGLRVKETTRLMPEDFDLEHRILTLRETKTGYKKDKKTGEKKRVPQRTTILPSDVVDFKVYLAGKLNSKLIWPVSRQTVWAKFKKMCIDSKLSFFWQKDERAFEKGWPYLLRSSRAKIMEKKGAEYSLIALKLRHKSTMVTMRYTAQDIHALLNWEATHYESDILA